MTGSLANRRILVTGASRGIGLAVAERLAEEGATLVLVARSSSLHDVAARLPGGPHQIEAMDVRDVNAWKEARHRLAPDGFLHGVITAAGVLGPVGPLGTWDVEEFRSTLEINVVGTLLAISTSLPAVKAARGSIVTFSGGGATSPMPRFDAYAASKAAVVRLTENLAADLNESGVRMNSIAPGFILTDIHESALEAGPERAGPHFDRIRQARETGKGDSPDVVADLAAFLMAESSVGITGKLISAQWDPWKTTEFQRRLRTEPDMATLRRIDDQFFTTVRATQPAAGPRFQGSEP